MRVRLDASLLKYAIPAVSDSEDFKFTNAAYNHARYQMCQRQMKHPLPQFNPSPETHEVFMTGGWEEGGTVVMTCTPTETISYFVRFAPTPYGACQTTLWRDATDTTNQKIAGQVFWFLCDHYGAICSDALHTPKGRSFWVHKLEEAEQKGYQIGLLNQQTKDIDWKQDVPLQKWLIEREVWTTDGYHLRIIIKK